jgi:ankyrin repeat protein
VVKLLVAAGATVDPQASDELGPLASAAMGGHLEVVKYLVEEAGADESRAGRGGWTPLMWAIDKCQTDVVAYLLARPGIDINAKADARGREIDLASWKGHLDLVKLLVAAGATVDPQASDEPGPLAAAALGGHLEVVKYLVEEAGADESRAGRGGWTPLMWAVDKRQTDVVEYLLGRPGVNINAKTDKGERAIDFACAAGHLEVVKLLVAAGATIDPQASDESGGLIAAALGGHLEVVKYLVEEAGADECRAGWGGKTPLMCAGANNHPHVVEYLQGITAHKVSVLQVVWSCTRPYSLLT